MNREVLKMRVGGRDVRSRGEKGGGGYMWQDRSGMVMGYSGAGGGDRVVGFEGRICV